MKVILSQGQGKLQLIQTSIFLKRLGVQVTYITGWLPRNLPPAFVNFVGKLVGKDNLYKRLMVRQPAELANHEIKTCSWAEAYIWMLFILAKFKLISTDKALTSGWIYYGKTSKKYIYDAEIFHVRSGAGQGGAIKKAKSANMKVVVDHSIAHPKAIKKYLESEYKRFNIPLDYDPDSEFWKLVIKDCVDADYVVVNSDFVKDTFIENGFIEEKLKVLYLGVLDAFMGTKKTWSIASSEPAHLLFVGEFGFRKGAHVLIDAINILNKRGMNVVADIIGSTADNDLLQQQHTIPANIVFHGTCLYDELIARYSTADMYVFPTFAEGSSRAAMEAMATGLPVVTTLNCGAPIQHNDTGIIVPVNNALALADEIERLINDEALRQKIGQNAAEHIKTNFSFNSYSHNLLTFYRGILNDDVKAG